MRAMGKRTPSCISGGAARGTTTSSPFAHAHILKKWLNNNGFQTVGTALRRVASETPSSYWPSRVC